MSRALEIRAISVFGRPTKDDFASSAPPVVVAKRAATPEGGAFAASAAKLDALDVSQLEILWTRPQRPFGLGAAASLALHLSFVLGALLWSQSQIERAPEPIAVEIVVERAPDPAPPAPEPQRPVAEAPPPADPSPSPPPELVPSPVAVSEPPPLVVETPPPPPPEPIPPPVAAVEPPPATEAPQPLPLAPKLVAKVEPPKPAPPPKKADPAPQTPARPKPAPKSARTHEANAAETPPSRAAAPASSASVGEYRDSVYARIRARQHFPEAARESGKHGTAELNFALDESGQLKSVAIVKSAGDAELDADALATLRRSAPFGPPPAGAPRDYAVKLHYALQ